MSEGGAFLTDLGMVLIVAAVALLLVRMLRQPLILGYLVAGVVVGPFGFTPVRLGLENIETMAQLGILFIMASLGLEFHPKKLRAIGAVAFVAAALQILVSFAAGMAVANHLGLDRIEAVFIAGALSISSTLVAVKALEAADALDSPHGRLAIGILLIQDVVSVAFLAVVGGVQASGEIEIGTALGVLGGLGVFTLVALIVGVLLFPRFIHYAARSSEELLLIVILGIVFGVSLLAVHFGFSIALGAFIVGAIIAETRIVGTAERMVEPLKDMFTAVFFVSVGMLIDPRVLVDDWALVLVLSVLVVLTRMFLIPLPSFLFGTRSDTGMRAGASLSQVGEFSFIIISAGVAIQMVDPRYLAVFTGVAGITTLATPYLIRAADPVLRFTSRLTPAPMRTFSDVYSEWVERLGEAEETQVHRRREFELLRRLLLNVVALVVIGGLAFLGDGVLGQQTVEIGQHTLLATWFFWPIVAIVSLPFLFTIWTALRELALEVVLELVPDRLASDPHAWPVRLVRTSLGLAMALVLGGVAFAIVPEFGPGARPVLIIVLALLIVMVALFWHQVRHLHGHVERTITDIFGAAAAQPIDKDEVLKVIGIHYSISLETESMLVGEGSAVAFQSIQRAQIRNRSGASIVCIDRPEGRIVNPHPDIILRPGDHILVMGERHHLEKAHKLLQPNLDVAEPQVPDEGQAPVNVREVTVPRGSPVVEKSIAELRVRSETGASLVAAIRDSEHIQNPAPGFRFHGGDRLFFFGTADQLDRAQALVLTGDAGGIGRFRAEVGRVEGIDLPVRAPKPEPASPSKSKKGSGPTVGGAGEASAPAPSDGSAAPDRDTGAGQDAERGPSPP